MDNPAHSGTPRPAGPTAARGDLARLWADPGTTEERVPPQGGRSAVGSGTSASADPLARYLNLADLEAEAARRLSAAAFAYYAGGAGDERTVADNRAAFGRWRIVPRVLADVTVRDPSVDVLGRRWPVPLFVAPTALHRLAHPAGELASARAAAQRGIVFTLSTVASTDASEVAAVGGPRWFQLYPLADQGRTTALLDRVLAAGYEAIVLTVDAPYLGRRERDLRLGFRLPPGVGYPNLAGLGIDPYGQSAFLERLTWPMVETLAARLPVPLILKGILHPDDAREAFQRGAAAIVVSNHGGRQLDGAIASLDALPAVVEAAGTLGPILADGGIRRGTDLLVALALGARAVGLGRPILYGLAVAGEAGVGRVLDLLIAEVDLALALAGVPRAADLHRGLLRQSPKP